MSIICPVKERAAGRPKSGFLRIPEGHPAIMKPISIAGSCRRMRRISAFSRWTDYRYGVNVKGHWFMDKILHHPHVFVTRTVCPGPRFSYVSVDILFEFHEVCKYEIEVYLMCFSSSYEKGRK